MRLKHQVLSKLCSVNRYYVLYSVLFIYFIWPSRFAMLYYENISLENIYDSLVKKTIKNATLDKVHCVSQCQQQ
jgi:hypothetical protein